MRNVDILFRQDGWVRFPFFFHFCSTTLKRNGDSHVTPRYIFSLCVFPDCVFHRFPMFVIWMSGPPVLCRTLSFCFIHLLHLSFARLRIRVHCCNRDCFLLFCFVFSRRLVSNSPSSVSVYHSLLVYRSWFSLTLNNIIRSFVTLQYISSLIFEGTTLLFSKMRAWSRQVLRLWYVCCLLPFYYPAYKFTRVCSLEYIMSFLVYWYFVILFLFIGK